MLRIDHLVVNIDKNINTDELEIQSIRNTGFLMSLNGAKEQKGLRHLIFGLEMNTLK